MATTGKRGRMSEVEKMYELAVINKKCIDKRYEKCTGVCYDCKYFIYPPFSAEKQIAILQLLTQRCDLTISHFGEWEFIHYDGREPLEIKGKDFTETFAKLISAYWQDLTESEREQIAEILRR